MDAFAPYFDSSLIGPDGRLTRLHKGGGAPTPPPVTPAPAAKGQAATNVEIQASRDPNKRVRGSLSTILTNGLDNNFGRKSILGG